MTVGDTLSRWRRALEDGSVILAYVSAILTAWFGNERAKVVAELLAVAATIAAPILYLRRRRRRRAPAVPAELGARRIDTTSFRGLSAFRSGDTLPGAHRRRVVAALASQIAEDDFIFGTLCGDVGSGKTSFLRAGLVSALGPSVDAVYVRSPRSVVAAELRDHKELHSNKPASAAQVAEALRQLLRRHRDKSSDRYLVLLLDQFEEVFLDISNDGDRAKLAEDLRHLITSHTKVKVLCAVRRDFIMDLHRLVALPAPALGKTLFELEDFTTEEAANVIRECATQDCVPYDPEFADLVAKELSHRDRVRAVELQLVCSGLADLSLKEYASRGGAQAILGSHVARAIESSRDARIARKVLRSLCDFPARARRDAQSVQSILAVVGEPAAIEPVSAILAQLEQSRITVSRGGLWSLAHDYLVPAVASATQAESTRQEEADHLLLFHLRGGPNARIPFRDLRSIQRHASRRTLSEHAAKQLIRRSRRALAIQGVCLVAGVVALIFVGVSISRFGRTWNRRSLARLTALAGAGQVYRLDSEYLLTTTFGQAQAQLWNMQDPTAPMNIDGAVRVHMPYSLVLHKDAKRLASVKWPTIQHETDIPASVLAEARFDPSGRYVSYRVADAEHHEHRVVDLGDHREVGRVHFLVSSASDVRAFPTDDLVLATVARSPFSLYQECMAVSLSTDQVVGEMSLPDTDCVDFAVDTIGGHILTLHAKREVVGSAGHPRMLAVWKLRTGELVAQRSVKPGMVLSGLSSSSLQLLEGNLLSIDGTGLTLNELYSLDSLEAALPSLDAHGYLATFGGDYAQRQLDLQHCCRFIVVTDPHRAPVIRDVLKRTEVEIPRLNGAGVVQAMTNGEQVVIVTASGELWIWRAPNTEVVELAPANARVQMLSVDGASVAVGFADGSMAIYDVRSAVMVARLEHVDGFSAFAYDSSMRSVTLWADEGAVIRYTDEIDVFGFTLLDARSSFGRWALKQGQ